MDRSFREQESNQHAAGSEELFSESAMPIFESLIKWLASLIKWTEEEQEEAGIYLGRLGGE